jgi:CRISPR type I-E-associated protein CasB/Cse2
MKTETKNTFLSRLRQLVDKDRGNRAALRRYWSPATRHQAYPILGRLGALEDKRKSILAALYAEHAEHRAGQTVGKAALRLGDRKEGEHPYDRHFRRLLACDTLEDLAQQLHRLSKRLQREGIGLDYEELHKNLNYWSKYREDVKVRWAADFWQAPVEQIQTEAPAV